MATAVSANVITSARAFTIPAADSASCGPRRRTRRCSLARGLTRPLRVRIERDEQDVFGFRSRARFWPLRP